MVRINADSIFKNVDLDNADSIRRIMVGLNYYLTNRVLRQAAPELRQMQSREQRVANTILATIRTSHGYPLFLEATLRFIEARTGNNQQILVAARGLEILATGIVLTLPQSYPVEYAAAQALFDRTRAADNFVETRQSLQERAPGAFDRQVFSSKTGTDLEMLKKSMEPRIPKESPLPTLNTKPCKRCIQTKIMCTREEPECWGCSRNGLACEYPPPGEEFERSPSPPALFRGGIPKDNFSSREKSENAGELDEDEMDIDGDEGFSTRGPSKKREYESDESSQSSKSSDQPEKGKSSKKIRLGGAVKLILRTNTPAKSKGKIIASLSSSTSNLSSAPESEELQDPFTNNEEENEGNTPHKNKPIRQPGDRAIDDGSHNRAPCKVGQADPNKLVIEFKIERDDPSNPGKTIQKPNVKFAYRHPINWNNKESVQALTKWRGQLFFRVLGKKRDGRVAWLESERDVLFEILQEHLIKVEGRWSRIQWDVVAKMFNKRFEGVTQKAGEMTAERRYNLNNSTMSSKAKGSKTKKTSDTQATSTSQALKKDRQAPQRSGGSLRAQLANFTDPLAQKIIDQAKAEDRKANHGDSAGEGLNTDDDEVGEDDDESFEGLDGDLEGEGYTGDDDSAEANLRIVEEAECRERRTGLAAAAEEQRQIDLLTNPRQIAKDRLGKRWLRGG